MNIFRVTPAKSDDFGPLYGIGRMKPLMTKVLLALYLGMVPLFVLEVQGPEVVEVGAAGLTTHDYHKAGDQCCGMVCSRGWQAKIIVLLMNILIILNTFDVFGYVYRPVRLAFL